MTALEGFPDGAALADAVEGVLAGALAGSGAKSFVATGGETSGPVYDRLAGADLDWRRITVTLSDERWVGADQALSNEKLVRDRLLVGRAARARLAPLKGDGATPTEDAAAAEPAIGRLLPFSAVLLGMGADGHIGSLFPGAPGLAEALDPGGARLCVGVETAGLAPFVPRISLTVRAFLASRMVIIIITGAAKRALVDKVLTEPGYSPPVAALLRQKRTPVRLMWAP